MLNTWCVFRLKQAGPDPFDVLSNGQIPREVHLHPDLGPQGHKAGHSPPPPPQMPHIPLLWRLDQVRETPWLVSTASPGPAHPSSGSHEVVPERGRAWRGGAPPSPGDGGSDRPTHWRPGVISTRRRPGCPGRGSLWTTGVPIRGAPCWHRPRCPGRWHPYPAPDR